MLKRQRKVVNKICLVKLVVNLRVHLLHALLVLLLQDVSSLVHPLASYDVVGFSLLSVPIPEAGDYVIALYSC